MHVSGPNADDASQCILNGMPQIDLSQATVNRLDELAIEDESYDQIINELINIYQSTERSLAHGGDEYH